MSAMSSDFKEHSGKNTVLLSEYYKCLSCVHKAELGCRHDVWELNTFGVSLVPFHMGEGRSFSPILRPFEPDSFKGVHLMQPQAPNIFRRVLCRMKKRRERGGPWAVQITPRKSESFICQEKQ